MGVNLEVSERAIDLASLHCLKHWRRTRRKNEGLRSWLDRKAAKALKERAPRSAHYGWINLYEGLVFYFSEENWWTVCRLVMPSNSAEARCLLKAAANRAERLKSNGTEDYRLAQWRACR